MRTDEVGFIAIAMFQVEGIFADVISWLKPVWTQANEFALGIHTVPHPSIGSSRSSTRPWWLGEPSERARHDDNVRYETADYWNIRKVARILKPGPEDVFYDIGSGMGRMLCVMARRPIRKCIGIELFEPLCEIARRNVASLRGRKAPVEIRCADAATADLSDGTIYYMFNPFGEETLRDALENIRTSLSRKSRTVTLVYYNAVHETLLNDIGWLEKIGQFNAFGGHVVSLWRSTPARHATESTSNTQRDREDNTHAAAIRDGSTGRRGL